MRKILAWFIYIFSIIYVLGCNGNNENETYFLTSEEIVDAKFVFNWLRSNKDADQTKAQIFFQQGMREKNKNDWSRAVKSFGESILFYPNPEALNEYMNAKLHMLSSVRKREGSIREKLGSDMRSALQYYRSAQAADTVLGTLSKRELGGLQAHIDCLETYAASGRSDLDCQPLRWYYDTAR